VLLNEANNTQIEIFSMEVDLVCCKCNLMPTEHKRAAVAHWGALKGNTVL